MRIQKRKEEKVSILFYLEYLKRLEELFLELEVKKVLMEYKRGTKDGYNFHQECYFKDQNLKTWVHKSDYFSKVAICFFSWWRSYLKRSNKLKEWDHFMIKLLNKIAWKLLRRSNYFKWIHRHANPYVGPTNSELDIIETEFRNQGIKRIISPM